MVPLAFDAGSIESTLRLDRTPFNAGLRQAQADAAKLEKRGVRVKLDLDTKALDQQWRKTVTGNRELDISLNLKFGAAISELDTWRKAQTTTPIRLPVEIDTRPAQLALAKFRSRQAARPVELALNVATQHATTRLAAFRKVAESAPVELDAAIPRDEALSPGAMRDLGGELAEDISTGIRRSKAPESAGEVFARRMNRRASALVGLGWFVGLPAAAAIGAAGATAALAAVPVAMFAIGTAAVMSSQEVRDAYSDLWADIQQQTEAQAQPVEDTLLAIADRVGDTYEGIAPQLGEMFEQAHGPMLEFTDGVLNLGIYAIPGMVRAVQQSMPAIVGWNRLLTQIGGGLGDLFDAVTGTGPATITTMEELGGVVRDLLGFVGNLLVALSENGGPILAQFRAVMRQIYDILLDLTGPGFGALEGAISGFLDVISTALTLVEGFTSLLGGWAAPILYAAGALKALNMISFGQLGKQFDMITGKVKTAQGWGAKIATGLRGGLIGAAITGGLMLINGLIDIFTRNQRLAEQGALQNRNAQEQYNAALRKTAGLLTEVSKQEILNSDLGKKAAENVRILGYDYGRFVDAVTRGGNAANDILSANEEHFRELLSMTGQRIGEQFIDSFRELAENGQGAASMLDQIRTATVRYGDELRKMGVPEDVIEQRQAWFESELTRTLDLQGQFGSLVGAVDEYNDTIAESSAIVRELSPAQWAAQQSSRALDEAMQTLAETTGSVDDRARALIETLDILSGRQPSLEEAVQGFNDLIRRTADSFGNGIDQAKGFGDALVNTDGTINTLTENGSKLQDFLTEGAEKMATVAAAMRDAGEPAADITTKLGGMREALEGQLEAWGLAPETIQRVLDTYNAVPERITTTLLLEGDEESLNQLKDVQGLLSGLPETTPVEVEALTDRAQLALLELGYEIVSLPDGTFRVFSNTEPGRRAAKQFIADYDGRAVRLTADLYTADAQRRVETFIRVNSGREIVVYTTVRNPDGSTSRSFNKMNAVGNILKFAQGGMMPALTPMPAGIAQIVPPNTWRVVGDRAQDDEAYIPINSSPRSQSLLAETARLMGYALLPMATGGVLDSVQQMVASVGTSTPATTATVRAPRRTTPAQSGDALIRELRALRQEVASLRGSQGNSFTIYATRETGQEIAEEAVFLFRHAGKGVHA